MARTHLPLKTIYFKKFIHRNVICQLILNWPCYTSDFSCIGASANTANLGPLTGPIRNHLIDNIIHVFFISD